MSLASKDAPEAPLKSISATELLKQQKQKQKELLQNRLQRAEEIQKRVLQNSAGPRPSTSTSKYSSSSSQGKDALMSPKAACEVPKGTQSPATPHAPTLGRGFSEGEDILFFEQSPPQPPATTALSLSAAKMAALKKLKAKGMGLAREDPNALKRKRGNSSEISARVEKNLASPEGTAMSDFTLLFSGVHLSSVGSPPVQNLPVPMKRGQLRRGGESSSSTCSQKSSRKSSTLNLATGPCYRRYQYYTF